METPQLGRESARKLLAAFGSLEATIAAATSARAEVAGTLQAAALAQAPDSMAPLTEVTLAWLLADSPSPRNVITLGDPRYPNSLLEAPDPPLMLYVEGRAELLAAPALAIVGRRSPKPAGRRQRARFRQPPRPRRVHDRLGSGGGRRRRSARGRAGWRGQHDRGGRHRLDRIYPKLNLALGKSIASKGLIVSEYSLGTPPLATNFPRRNRIIAGMARGTLMVEAALQSGSLITARMANEAGCEVFAISGSIHSPQSRGCHALIKQGAKLAETAQDILDELRWPGNAPPAGRDAPPDAGDPLLAALGFDPVTLDALVGRTNSSAAELSVRLLDLELGGQVARLPGQLFQRVTRG